MSHNYPHFSQIIHIFPGLIATEDAISLSFFERMTFGGQTKQKRNKNKSILPFLLFYRETEVIVNLSTKHSSGFGHCAVDVVNPLSK